MSHNTLYAIFWIAIASVIITITATIGMYNYGVAIKAFECGLEQVQKEGTTITSWQYTDKCPNTNSAINNKGE